MFVITIGTEQCEEGKLELRTQDRKLARAAMQLAQENNLPGEVTEEVVPRVVKFKGVD